MLMRGDSKPEGRNWMEDRWGVYVREINGKFRVEHRYMAKPNIEEPTTFDDQITDTVGVNE
jgi:hypothetical protein